MELRINQGFGENNALILGNKGAKTPRGGGGSLILYQTVRQATLG